MTSNISKQVTRRVAVGGVLGASVAGLGQAVLPAAAQAVNLADHPMAGTWMAMANPPLPDSPQFAAPSLFSADGTVLLMFPLTQVGPQGGVMNSAYVGVWEPDSDRRAHFTAVQVLSDAEGNFTGTVTVDGYPEASEDGMTFIDDGSRVMVTMRDPAGAIIQQIMPPGKPEGRPVTGVRMAVGNPGFPEGGPAATPTT